MRYLAILTLAALVLVAGCKGSDDDGPTIPVAGLVLSPKSLPVAMPGLLYSQVISATLGQAPYTYEISVGAPPATFTLDENTGELSGTPDAPGTFTFTVTATDSTSPLALTGWRSYHLVVTDGAAGWTRGSLSAVVSPTTGWEAGAVGFPCVIKEGAGDYRMWYSASDTVPTTFEDFLASEVSIGYATSADGLTWSKYGANPVLSATGVTTDPDGAFVGAACVVKKEATYHMFYTGGKTETIDVYEFIKPGICHATSLDGTTWTRAGVAVEGQVSYDFIVFPPSVEIDARLYYAPWVVWDDGAGLFRMWVSSITIDATVADQEDFEKILEEAQNTIAYTTSPDGENWNVANDGVLSPSQAWESGGVSSPCVTWDADESTYKMFYTGTCETGSAIGFAKSTNGTSWTKSSLNPVFEAADTGWDGGSVGTPSVIKDGSVPCYKMWYTGTSAAGQAMLGRIGYATCPEIP